MSQTFRLRAVCADPYFVPHRSYSGGGHGRRELCKPGGKCPHPGVGVFPGAGPPNARTPLFSLPHILVKIELFEVI